MERTKISVGMLATEYVGSDRYPYEVIEVTDGWDRVTVREMVAMPKKVGFDYYTSQDYDYFPDPNGREVVLTRRKDGGLRPVGAPIRERVRFAFGYASFYRDPCF